MKNLYTLLILLIFIGAKNPKEYEYKTKVKVLEEVYCKQQNIINNLETELEYHRNHVKRMQLIVGAKDIDSVFSYKKKIVYEKQLLSQK